MTTTSIVTPEKYNIPLSRVYTLDPSLTEEQIAVIFAMTSRNPAPFDEIEQRVSAEKAADFSERWVLGYGHASVAEHGILHLAIENYSRVAVDSLMEMRLGSFTEKSSRYQVIEKGSYMIPHELYTYSEEFVRKYRDACDYLFESYHLLLNKLIPKLEISNPKPSSVSATQHSQMLRKMATDACRSVLPAATLTNVGMTINARVAEDLISKLLSSDLAEAIYLGNALYEASIKQVPTLIKYAKSSPYNHTIHKKTPNTDLRVLTKDTPYAGASPRYSKILDYSHDGLRKIASAILMRQNNDWARSWNEVLNLDEDQIADIIGEFVGDRTPHDDAPREFELSEYLYTLKLDYGALREYRRHRMQTILSTNMSVNQGYFVDPLFEEHDMDWQVRAILNTAELNAIGLTREMPVVLPYLVTHAHYQTILCKANLRELYHIFRLRLDEKAHVGIRTPLGDLADRIENLTPTALRWL